MIVYNILRHLLQTKLFLKKALIQMSMTKRQGLEHSLPKLPPPPQGINILGLNMFMCVHTNCLGISFFFYTLFVTQTANKLTVTKELHPRKQLPLL